MPCTILQGDCIEMLATLPAESVHCCITSPPYWGLRDYGCEGQIGLEPTPEAHIAALVAVFRAVWRVLRKDGSLWVNYGDCYACAPNGRSAADTKAVGEDDRTFRDKPFSTVTRGKKREGLVGGLGSWQERDVTIGARAVGVLKPKDLVGMPWRLALALQADGWWLRSDVVWSKPNPMPESVTDRPTRSHEYLFLLAKSERYFYDADAVRERTGNEMSLEEYEQARGGWGPPRTNGNGILTSHAGAGKHDGGKSHPAGRNKRTVWTIPTESYSEAHFATFPRKLVEPCLLAGTSAWGCCATCGAPFVRQVEKGGSYWDERKQRGEPMRRGQTPTGGLKTNGQEHAAWKASHPDTTTGWAQSCPCFPCDIAPCRVLDPFGGSGTVGAVAIEHGRDAILCELNPEYVELARRRTGNAQPALLTV